MSHPPSIRAALAALLIFVIHSCHSRSDDLYTYIDKSTKTIPINTAGAKTADFSDLFVITGAVRLATSDSVIIGSIDKICHLENRYYILDGKTNYLDIFDDRGRLLFKIGENGEGVGKYFRIADFNVDTVAGLIYLLDDFRRKMIVFSNIDGHFVRERPLFNFTVNRFLFRSGDGGPHFIFSRGGAADGTGLLYNLLIADTSNHIEERCLPYQPTGTFVLSPVDPLQEIGNRISYLPPFSNTIYELNSNRRISAKYILDFKGSNADFGNMQKDLRENRLPTVGDLLHYLGENNYVQFLNFYESAGFLYVFYETRKLGSQLLIYCKKDDSGLLVSTIRNNYIDLPGHLVGVDSDRLISVMQPDSFLDREKLRSILPAEDRALFNDWGAKENPILVLLKPKLSPDETPAFLNGIRKTEPNIQVRDTAGFIPRNAKLVPYPYSDCRNDVSLSSLLDPGKKSVLFYIGEAVLSSCDICISEEIAAANTLSNRLGIRIIFVTNETDGRTAQIFKNRHNLNNFYIFERPSTPMPNIGLSDFCLVAPIN